MPAGAKRQWDRALSEEAEEEEEGDKSGQFEKISADLLRSFLPRSSPAFSSHSLRPISGRPRSMLAPFSLVKTTSRLEQKECFGRGLCGDRER